MVALSTAEAEYIAFRAAIGSIQALKQLVVSTGILPNMISTIKNDNRAAYETWAKRHGTKLVKFIDLRHHHIQYVLKTNKLLVLNVPAAGQKADMFTKSLQRIQ